MQVISFSTIDPGMTIVVNAELQDGYKNLTPAVGGGRCADRTYVWNFYGADMIGQKIVFNVQITETQESDIEYMFRNYSEFFLSYSTKTCKAGLDNFQFGTGNDQITFVILEEDI